MKNMMVPILFKDYLLNKCNYSESTANRYYRGINKFIFDAKDLSDLKYYNEFIIEHCEKKRTTSYYNMLLKFVEFYDFEVERIIKGYDSAAKIKRELRENMIKPRQKLDLKRERRHLTSEQIVEIINIMENDKHKIIALIQSITGVRSGDVLKMKRGDIIPETYDDEPVLRLNITGKGGKRNVVYIHDMMIQDIVWDFIINNWYDDEYYFIESREMKRIKDTPYSPEQLIKNNYDKYRLDLKLALNSLNIRMEDFSTHDFRRCFARRVWEKYKDLTILQRVLNHKDPRTTILYLNNSGLQNIDIHKDMQNNM